jgi:GNAT superfamily N-acetyltransferase
METDFHYYCTAVIAKAAGFDKREALTIAYASQYVDHATENKPIAVGEIKFDPVRTAHNGLKAYTRSIQNLVYVPFHFLPEKPVISKKDSFITKSDSAFAHYLLHHAALETDPEYRLYRLGVALHTFADTWAHEGFSGRKNIENHVEKIYVKKGFHWKKPHLKRLILSILPHVGHAEASVLPDKPYLKWKYFKSIFKREEERDNQKYYLHAAQKMYQALSRVRPNSRTVKWNRIQEKIQEIFSFEHDSEEARCIKWREHFEEWFHPFSLKYDKNEWRKKALGTESGDVEWDNFRPEEFQSLHFSMARDFTSSSWVRFHQAARQQRNLVLTNVCRN